MISLSKRLYGASPLHLLGQLLAFAITAYALTQVIDVTSTDNTSLVLWFVAGALLHDLIFVPIYLTLDLLMRLGIQDHPLRHPRLVNHVRVPVAISAVLLITTFPLVLGKNGGTFARTAGEQPPDYLGRWLLVTAILLGLSALLYAVRAGRASRRRSPLTAPAGASPTSP